MLDAGAGLVAKSMIVADEASGTTRYHMLETLRTFAREHLEAARRAPRRCSGVTPTTTHAFAEAADAGLAGPDEVAWRKRVHLEFDNLRAAFIRCLILGEDDDVRHALRIVAALAFEAVNDRGLGIGGGRSTSRPASISRHRRCVPRCSRRRRSARRVATTSRRCASSPTPRCVTGCRPNCPGRGLGVHRAGRERRHERRLGRRRSGSSPTPKPRSAPPATRPWASRSCTPPPPTSTTSWATTTPPRATPISRSRRRGVRRTRPPPPSAQFARAVALSPRRSRGRGRARREHRARTARDERWSARVRAGPPLGDPGGDRRPRRRRGATRARR